MHPPITITAADAKEAAKDDAKPAPLMTIELVFSAMGAKPSEEWWIKIAGTSVVRLDLSPRACETEVRMLAEQVLSEMVKEATIAR